MPVESLINKSAFGLNMILSGFHRRPRIIKSPNMNLTTRVSTGQWCAIGGETQVFRVLPEYRPRPGQPPLRMRWMISQINGLNPGNLGFGARRKKFAIWRKENLEHIFLPSAIESSRNISSRWGDRYINEFVLLRAEVTRVFFVSREIGI